MRSQGGPCERGEDLSRGASCVDCGSLLPQGETACLAVAGRRTPHENMPKNDATDKSPTTVIARRHPVYRDVSARNGAHAYYGVIPAKGSVDLR